MKKLEKKEILKRLNQSQPEKLEERLEFKKDGQQPKGEDLYRYETDHYFDSLGGGEVPL